MPMNLLSGRFLILVAVCSLLLSSCLNAEQKHRKYLDLAQSKYDEGDYTAARIYLLNAIEADPSSPETYYLKARVSLALQHYRAAFSAFESAVELAPDNRQLLLDYVTFLISGRKYDRAVMLLNQWLDKNGGDDEVKRQLSRALAGAGVFGEARDVANLLVQDHPDSVENWLNLVYVSLMNGDRFGTERALAMAAERTPPGDLRVVLAQIEFFLNTGRVDAAALKLEKLVKQYPDNLNFAMRLAQVREHSGDLKEAIALYKNILEKEENPVIRNRLGLLMREDGDVAGALAQWGRASDLNPYGIEPRINMAKAYLNTGEMELASRYIKEVLRIDPGHGEGLALRGILALNSRRFAEAVPDLEKAVAWNRENTQWLIALARAYAATDNKRSALRIYEDLFGQDQANGTVKIAYAMILSEEGKYEESSMAASRPEVLEEYPVQANEVLGINSLALRMPQKAVEFFLEASRSAPDNPRLKMRLAAALDAKGLTEKALQQLKGLLDERPAELLPLSAYVGILVRTGSLDKAVAAARGYHVDESPGHGVLLAEVLDLDGKVQEALEVLRGLIARHPDYEPAYFRFVSLYSKEGDIKEARDWLKDILKGKKPNRYGLLFLQGLLQDEDEDREAANESYMSAIKEKPDYVPAMNNLAWNLVVLGKNAEALKVALKARKFAPDDPLLADTYAWILHRSGDSAGALPILRRASQALPANNAIGMHLVEVLRAVGREDEAQQRFEMIRRIGNHRDKPVEEIPDLK